MHWSDAAPLAQPICGCLLLPALLLCSLQHCKARSSCCRGKQTAHCVVVRSRQVKVSPTWLTEAYSTVALWDALLSGLHRN